MATEVGNRSWDREAVMRLGVGLPIATGDMSGRKGWGGGSGLIVFCFTGSVLGPAQKEMSVWIVGHRS